MEQYFWSKADVNGSAECWEWLWSCTKRGYGIFNASYFGKKQVWKAHRFAWILWNEQDPGKLYVCHKCNNPSCVNPNHLYLGTQKDNMADVKRLKRNFNARKTHCKYGHEFFGENLRIVNYKGRESARVCCDCRRIRLKRFRLNKKLKDESNGKTIL